MNESVDRIIKSPQIKKNNYRLDDYKFFFLNRPLLPCDVEGFLLVNLLDNW
jgi:hypothetical protein